MKVIDQTVDIISRMGDGITEGLDEISVTAVDYASALSATSQLICGIAAFAYIGSKLWSSWARGNSIDFYSMLRPFAVGLLILFFPLFTGCMDMLVKPIIVASEYIGEQAKEEMNESIIEYEKANMAVCERKTAYEIGSNGASEKKSYYRQMVEAVLAIRDAIAGGIDGAVNYIGGVVVQLCLSAVQIFTIATVYFFRIYVATAKIILVLVGPFALALSVFPSFQGNLRMWICQYINISLYIPICNIIAFIQSMIISKCLYLPATKTLTELASGVMDAGSVSQIESTLMMMSIAGIIINTVAIMLYAHVPTFANWILRGDGSGGLAAAFSIGGGFTASRMDSLNPDMSAWGRPSNTVAGGQSRV